MANTIQIKRNSHTGTGAPSSLAYGEIAYNNNNGAGGKLYVGGKASDGTAQIEDITNNITAQVPVATAAANSGAATLGKASFLNNHFTVSSGFTQIAGNAIGGTELASAAVAATHLASNAVTTAKIQNGAVTTAKLVSTNGSETVTGDVIRASAVGTTEIADDAVTNAKLADDAVDSAQIADGAIDQVHISLNAVSSGNLRSNVGTEAVTTGVIRDSNVTEAKIASNSISNAKMKDNSVDTAELVNDAVTAAKIVDNITLTGNCGTSGNFQVGGDLTVIGTTTTVNSTTVTLDDVVLTLGGDTAPSNNTAVDMGIEFRYRNLLEGAAMGFFGYDDSAKKFTMLTGVTNSSGAYSGSAGTLVLGTLEASSITGATINGGNYS